MMHSATIWRPRALALLLCDLNLAVALRGLREVGRVAHHRHREVVCLELRADVSQGGRVIVRNEGPVELEAVDGKCSRSSFDPPVDAERLADDEIVQVALRERCERQGCDD